MTDTRSVAGLLLLLALVGLAAASETAPGSPPILPVDPPARAGAMSPAVAAEDATSVTQSHEVLMTWLEPGDDGPKLMFARLSEGRWSAPVTIAEPVASLGADDRPTLTVFDTQAVRRTLIARSGDVLARSGNAGRTWSRLPSPILRHASFAGGDKGGYGFWLEAESGGSTQLLGSRVMAGRAILDDRVVGGSGTDAAMTWDGPVVVYRDRSAEGGEQIALVRRQDVAWTEPRAVHTERWHPAEEAQTPPTVAALERRVAVAWYTEAPPRPRVLVAFSTDAGRTFEPAVEVDARRGEHLPLGSVDVAMGDGDAALVVWTATEGADHTVLNLARVSADGSRGPEVVLAQGAPGEIGRSPQIVLADDRAAITWIEGDPGRVRAVTVPVPEIPAASGRSEPLVELPAAATRRYTGRGNVGDPLPHQELTSLAGEVVSLEALGGRVVLLNIWATWCLPCRAEMPELAELSERYAEQGLEVVGLSVDDAGALGRVQAFVEEYELPFHIWLDPLGKLAEALRVRALPATFLVGRDGRILLRRDEPIRADDPLLERAFARAFGSERLDDSPT